MRPSTITTPLATPPISAQSSTMLTCPIAQTSSEYWLTLRIESEISLNRTVGPFPLVRSSPFGPRRNMSQGRRGSLPPHRGDHRAHGISAEPLLESAAIPIAQARAQQPVPRSRECKDVIPDRVVTLVPFDRESLLPLLGVLRQGPVRKPVTSDRRVILEDVHDTASIERPHTQRPDEHGHRRADLDGCVRPEEFQPSEREHSPLAQGCSGASKIIGSMTESDSTVIDRVARGRNAPRGAYFGVGKLSPVLRAKERGDHRRRRLPDQEHSTTTPTRNQGANISCRTLSTLAIVLPPRRPTFRTSRSWSTVRIWSRMMCPALPWKRHGTRNG